MRADFKTCDSPEEAGRSLIRRLRHALRPHLFLCLHVLLGSIFLPEETDELLLPSFGWPLRDQHLLQSNLPEVSLPIPGLSRCFDWVVHQLGLLWDFICILC